MLTINPSVLIHQTKWQIAHHPMINTTHNSTYQKGRFFGTPNQSTDPNQSGEGYVNCQGDEYKRSEDH
jgi:hypothetical protein